MCPLKHSFALLTGSAEVIFWDFFVLIASVWLTSAWDECQWFFGTLGKTVSSERLFYRRARVWIEMKSLKSVG